jgi:hypothetical protein
VDAALAATLLGASSSWLHHSTVLFPAVVALGPSAQAAVVVLYGIAAAWRAFASFSGAGAAASFAGTAALTAIWLLSSRRAAEPC